MQRVIFHCDLNSFYASVELLEHPELRHLPVAVCGDPESRHGIILAKNEPAKKYQVKTAETVWSARKKCPELVLLSAHHDKYAHWSRRVNELYQQYTDLVEPFGIDESWLDMTGSLHLFGGDARKVAEELRGRVRSEFGLTISVGISYNKLFAKLGSDYQKPDATTVITQHNYRDILWPLPVTDMLFVGKAAAETLKRYGIETIGDLAQFDREVLFRKLGKQGAQLHDYANGSDHSPVQAAHLQEPPKSIGNGLTFSSDLLGEAQVRGGIVMLADKVARRLRRHGLKCGGVHVTIRDTAFHDKSKQRRLDCPTNVARQIAAVAMELIGGSWNFAVPIRALTVTGIYLMDEGQSGMQLDLLSGEGANQKLEHLEQAVDHIRNKYGTHAIQAASTPYPPNPKVP